MGCQFMLLKIIGKASNMTRKEIQSVLEKFPYDYDVCIIDDGHKCIISKHKVYDISNNVMSIMYKKQAILDEWFEDDNI